jgi:hypothetical protein
MRRRGPADERYVAVTGFLRRLVPKTGTECRRKTLTIDPDDSCGVWFRSSERNAARTPPVATATEDSPAAPRRRVVALLTFAGRDWPERGTPEGSDVTSG